ncbi:MAG: beta-lactamase family protein [Nevskiaceae bacterium]|nr:beta-lactamase family protein [Nevskiaceae bacterium]
MRHILCGAAALLAASLGMQGVLAQELPTASPESVGMSAEGLAKINAAMQRFIEAGTIANAVTIVARRGKVVHYEAHGYLDPNAKTPMPKDALFRMASSSKPVTTVGVLALVDEGKLRLDDPVSKYIPEFANTKVAVLKPGTAEPPPLPPGAAAPPGPPTPVDLVSVARPVTIRDLLTHTSGLMSGGVGARQVNLPLAANDTLATFIPKLGGAPLDFQPGTRWAYSATAGFDTLSRIIEVVSGKTFDVYLKERIFTPLQMNDTVFVVPASAQSRMNLLYRRNEQGQWQATAPPPAFSSTTLLSGGAGLISTARDYARFEQMLLNGGEFNGKRILKPETVQAMRTDQVPGLFHGMNGGEEGMGFGYGIAVTLDSTKARLPRSNGSAGWYGAYGTMSWNDPKEQIVGVIMLQQNAQPVQAEFGGAIMNAIVR